MIVKTKDDQQYGVITRVVKQGKSNVYMVQCYGDLPRAGPWLRKCSTMTTFSKGTALSLDDTVLIGYNYQDKKTGAIAYVYNRSEKFQLIQNANDYEVPSKLVQFLQDEGYDMEPDVTFGEQDEEIGGEDEEEGQEGS
jgi:hypothetical protein